MRFVLCCLFSLTVLTSFTANAQPKVVVTFPALYSLATMAMEGVGKPQLLLTAQQDAHHMQLRPSQMRAVLESDLFLYYDEKFELFVPKLRMAGSRKTKFLALSSVLGEEHRAPQDHGWLNPDFAIAMLHFLAVELGRIDPQHITQYTQNADSYASLIEDKAELWREVLLRQKKDAWIVSDHHAFMAFAGYFGLRNLMAIEDPQGEVNLRHLYHLDGKNIACVMMTHGRSALLDRVVEHTRALVYEAMNPMGKWQADGSTIYPELMDEMVSGFVQCYR